MRVSILPAMVACALFGIAELDAQTPALKLSTLPTSPVLSRSSLQSCGMAVDGTGSIYVGLFDSTLRKVAADGTVSIIAGSPGLNGSVDGTAATARLDADMGLAVDGSQTVYVCELSGAIRRVTSDGVVTTIAGLTGPGGFADGTGSAARFNGATRLCFDPSSGNLYVADTFNYAIRKVTPAGVVTTVAGQPGVTGYLDGSAQSALFTSPASIACDASGDLFVADYNESGSKRVGAIRKITPAGVVSTVASGLASNLELAVDAAGTAMPRRPMTRWWKSSQLATFRLLPAYRVSRATRMAWEYSAHSRLPCLPPLRRTAVSSLRHGTGCALASP